VEPAEGERRAAIGFAGQYGLAARIVYAHLSNLEWIHLADPDAGIADDFQFKAGPTRHALQVKWSQYRQSFTWSELTSATPTRDALLNGLARAWTSIRTTWDGPLVVHLCTNATPSAREGAAVFQSAKANGPRHLAAFLDQSFMPSQRASRRDFLSMGDLRKLEAFYEWESVWAELQSVSGLGDDDFLRFIEALEFDFGVGSLDKSRSTLDGAVDPQAQEDLRILAWTLQDCVADPTRPRRIDRAELLRRVGWDSRLRYRSRHEFPVPGTYTPNQAAIMSLREALATLEGGYLALIGPAGSGKSTLLSDLAFDGRVVRYYAFVPDSPNPLSHRGEAESFLNDISLALEHAGIVRTGQPSGLPGLRHCFEQQLARAQEAWINRRERTVIIIDGLDHIPREQTPNQSMLEELPPPAGLGDGVFIILGSQTTAVVSLEIREALRRPGRTVDLPPLASDEVQEVAEQAGLGDWLLPGQIEKFVEVTEGHPLAATFLLSELSALLLSTPEEGKRRERASEVLANASKYGGDVEMRYRGYFEAVRSEAGIVALLARVARLRTSLNLRWMSTWASAEVLRRFVAEARPFFRVDGDEWQFVHNSFRSFLADETALIDGEVSERRDRELHRDLADLCADSGDAWRAYRDEEVAHRYLAGDDHRVLALVTPASMRAKLRALHAAPVIRDHTNLGLRAAARSGQNTAFVQLALFAAELAQREQAFPGEQLAEALVNLRPAETAIDNVVRGSQVRIASNTAAAIAASWATQGHRAPAARVLNALGGIAALIDAWGMRSSEADGMADWAIATFHVSGLDAVLTQLERHLPLQESEPSAPDEDPVNPDQTPRDWRIRRAQEQRRHQRLEVLTACFDELLAVRDFATLDRVSARIDAEGDLGWRARGCLLRAITAAEDGDTQGSVTQIKQMLELEKSSQAAGHGGGTRVPLGFRLQAAVTLLSLGLSGSETFRALIGDDERSTISIDGGHDPESTYRQVLDMETVRHFLTISARGNTLRRDSRTAPDDPERVRTDAAETRVHDAAHQRILGAVTALARLRAEAIAARQGWLNPPAVAGRAVEILQVIEAPLQLTNNSPGWHQVRAAFPSLMAHTVHLAHRVGGSAELSRLSGILDRAWCGERARCWTVEFRHAALEQFAALDQSSHDWIRRKLDDTAMLITARSYDPESQVQAWLKHAELRSSLDQPVQALEAVSAAVDASLGLGMTDDSEQIAHWVGWLTAARRRNGMSKREYLTSVDRFASRLPGASRIDGDAAATAAERLIRECWQVSPMHAYCLGIELTDIGVLPEIDLVTSALQGSLDTQDASVYELSVHVAAEMLLPISGRDRGGVIERLRSLVTDAQRDRIDQCVKIWGLDEEAGANAMAPASNQTGDLPEGCTDASGPRPASTTEMLPTPINVGALLGHLRSLADGSELPEDWWNAAADTAFRDPIALDVARALVQEFDRLQSTEYALGLACGALAGAGDPEQARQALRSRLSKLPGGGWFRPYDGGTRRQLFAGALRAGAPEITSLALLDLAETLASGSFASTGLADEVRQILELVAGPDSIGATWSDVDAYLEICAPSDPSFRVPSVGTRLGSVPDSSEGALAALLGDFLGHPTKAAEEGTRRALIRLLTSGAPGDASRLAVLASLEDAVERGGWPAESALAVLLLASPDDPPATLVAAVEGATVGDDQILRDLARRVCIEWEMPPRRPPARRGLSPSYGLDLPPLRIHQPPELDANGVPFIDISDPQQVIAPFNNIVEEIAEATGLSVSAAMHRASQFARTSSGNRWTDAGHRAMADRLKRRGQRHIYRPWAYLVGRRAIGRVLAELTDAGLMGDSYPAFEWGLLAPDLLMLEPQPLPASIPQPWRPAATSSYDTQGWCEETQDAVEHYCECISGEPVFVLGETSKWVSLEWGLPHEEREVTPMRVLGNEVFGLAVQVASVESGGSACSYPESAEGAWCHQELMFRGFEQFSNAPFLLWIAFHPGAAEALDWEPLAGQRFAWRGRDGAWRVRTEYLARGLLSHSPPVHTFVAEVWRVVLSNRGREEVEDHFGPITRRLTVTRNKPEDRRAGTPEQKSSGYSDL
jgi:hypothetical protein